MTQVSTNQPQNQTSTSFQRQSSYSPVLDLSKLQIHKKIGQGKFPVYLTSIGTEDGSLQKLVMKEFPFHEGKASPYFEREIMFEGVEHNNVIQILGSEDQKKIQHAGHKKSYSSLMFLEYAPYGDFFDVLSQKKVKFTEKITRTYFKQLVSGLEYLHSNDVAHMDIKPENLLLGENFTLKMADFDLSYVKGVHNLRHMSRGTRFYRAPEVFVKQCQDPFKADIFSLGVMLFVMKTNGRIPFTEDVAYKGQDLYQMLINNADKFWKTHAEICGKDAKFFDAEFRFLFESLVKSVPEERASFEEIKKSKWFQGETYSDVELVEEMRQYFE